MSEGERMRVACARGARFRAALHAALLIEMPDDGETLDLLNAVECALEVRGRVGLLRLLRPELP